MKKEKINYKKTVGAAFVSSLPILAGYIMLGMGFGILLSEQGYGPLWALFMSITMYAGSMQYVAVDLLASGASLISSAIMVIKLTNAITIAIVVALNIFT